MIRLRRRRPTSRKLNRLADKILTSRERLQAHQEAPQCASCHRKIDPIGFGLENFDAVGEWRTEDSYQGAQRRWKADTQSGQNVGN